MRVKCVAVVENNLQRENLLECINIVARKFGPATPSVHRDTVTVEAEHPTELSEKLIELFEHYSRHEISTV